MKVVGFALLASLPLFACADSADPGNRAATANQGAAEVAAAGNEILPPAPENATGKAVDDREPPAKDEPIRGDGSRLAIPPPAEEAGACGASRYQYLVGRPRSAIPPKPAGANWRIACTGCPITMDYSPARLNIFYESETERIDEVRCG